jgi:2,3-bisphosphoglycerate-independent phosphoglycerate mutase
MKKILVILDGAADLPNEELDGKTPLDDARTPNLDYFAGKGKLGYMYPIDERTTPGSDNSLIAIFGNDPKKCRRGVYEAEGLGMEFKPGYLALRTNFGTINNLESRKVIDRRAGRTLTSKESKILCDEINKKVKLDCDFEFRTGVQHRGVLVLKGKFSDKITNTDPEWAPGKENLFLFSRSLDKSKSSRITSLIINDFLKQAFEVLDKHDINDSRRKKGLLPANMLFTRGGGTNYPRIRNYQSWMSINTMPLEIGIAKASNMQNFSFKYPELKRANVYKNLYKGLNKSIRFAIKTIKKMHNEFDGCYIQFKETDIPGHDNLPQHKKKMIEIIDRKFFGFLRKFTLGKEIEVVVTCDHCTPCKLKKHSADPVPVLVYPGEKGRGSLRFCEKDSKKGSLGKIYGKDFMKKTGLDK